MEDIRKIEKRKKYVFALNFCGVKYGIYWNGVPQGKNRYDRTIKLHSTLINSTWLQVPILYIKLCIQVWDSVKRRELMILLWVLAMWWSGLSHRLWHQYPVLTVCLLIQLSDNVPRKAVEDCQASRGPANHMWDSVGNCVEWFNWYIYILLMHFKSIEWFRICIQMEEYVVLQRLQTFSKENLEDSEDFELNLDRGIWGWCYSVVGKTIKLWPVTLAFHMNTGPVYTVSLLTQLPANKLEKGMQYDLSTYAPCMRAGNSRWSSGSWFWPDTVLVIMAIKGMNQKKKYLPLSVCLNFEAHK